MDYLCMMKDMDDDRTNREKLIKIVQELLKTDQDLDFLKELKAFKELDDLQGWERFRIHYFYPDIPSQENAR